MQENIKQADTIQTDAANGRCEEAIARDSAEDTTVEGMIGKAYHDAGCGLTQFTHGSHYNLSRCRLMSFMLTIRDVTLDDAPAITAIYEQAVLYGTASFEEVVPDTDEIRRRMVNILDAGLPYIVAAAGQDILGYAYAGPYRPRSAYRFTVEDSIYLAPDQQGRGIGSRLVSTLISRCEGLGLHRMIGVIGDPENSIASVRLHQRAGFKEVGRFHEIGYKFGQWRDSLLMERPLNP